MSREHYTLRMAVPEDIDALLHHGAREIAENGRDGVIFAPYEPESPKPITDERRGQIKKAFELSLSEPYWQRGWILLHTPVGAEPEIVGSLTLYGARLPSELHRSMLGMGIEHAHRGQGLGSWMLETAIVWAKSQTILSWIDLGVFSANSHARHMYLKFGFVVVGEREDAFRVLGQKITDISMSLLLH